jgi:hypothetical protein
MPVGAVRITSPLALEHHRPNWRLWLARWSVPNEIGDNVHVVAFAPALRAVLDEAGGIRTEGFPMTSCQVSRFPARITVPVVLALYTQGGIDHDPQRFIVARSPDGRIAGALECSWHWPDNPGTPVKFRVFAHQVPIEVQSPGVYTFGLYDSREAVDTDHHFPLPILKTNPFNRLPGESAQPM